MTPLEAGEYRRALAVITEQTLEAVSAIGGQQSTAECIPVLLIQLCRITGIVAHVLIDTAEQKEDDGRGTVKGGYARYVKGGGE